MISQRICTQTRSSVLRKSRAIHGRQSGGFRLEGRGLSTAGDSSRRKTRIDLEDLPKVALDPDGVPRASLPPLRKRIKPVSHAEELLQERPNAAKRACDVEEDIKVKWQRAIDDREFPDTTLAYGIFTNMHTYPDDLILTRVGMFYESYFTQAAEVAALLNIRLTSKSFKVKASKKSRNPTATQHKFPFAGFPISQREKYFQMILELGRSFVVVEEKDVPFSSTKDRFVARRYTPGTLLSEAWQVGDETRHLLALCIPHDRLHEPFEETPVGLAYIDISTDRAVQTRTSTVGELEHELARISPVEIVLPRRLQAFLESATVEPRTASSLDSRMLKEISATVLPLIQQSGARIAYVDGAEEPDASTDLEISAEQTVQTHLKECLLGEMPKLLGANHLSAESFMQIDASTLLGLEIRQSLRQSVGAQVKGVYSSPASRAGTLLSVIKRTLTPSGTRLLVNTLCQPSTDLRIISERHDLVEAFLVRNTLREDLRDQLKTMSNAGNNEISRIIQRFSAAGSSAPGLAGALAGGRDLWDLKQRIEAIDRLSKTIEETLQDSIDSKHVPSLRLRKLIGDMRNLSDWVACIDQAVVASVLDKSAMALEEASNGEVIEEDEESATSDSRVVQNPDDEKAGSWWISPDFNPTLSSLHRNLNDLLQEKADMQSRLRASYGLEALELKMSFNNSPSLIYVPKKRQTDFSIIRQDPEMAVLNETAKTVRTFVYNKWSVLANSLERTRDDILDAQKEAFKVLREQTLDLQTELLHNAGLLDEIDLCLGFAQVADELRFVRPEMTTDNAFEITNGRHPTVEFGLLSGRSARNFTPNSLHLDPDTHLAMITGPNMAGKSTLLRQMAIVAILAQAGSFVPADKARLGIVDAVFSRVGARDDLFMDRSTFMMEMHETAHILNKATPRSLVIMDEIGRGTTLNSGIAIAYAALDYILRHNKSKTLFATHYHELYDMLTTTNEKGKRTTRPGVEFWCTDVDEVDGRFTYSYRLKAGVNRQSHAIKTAQQAGMPEEFLRLAESTLLQLEAKDEARTALETKHGLGDRSNEQ